MLNYSVMSPRSLLSLGNFLSSLHLFLIVYIATPYLATFMPEDQTGLVISLGAVMTLAVFPLMPYVVARYGAQKLAVWLAFFQAVVLTLLSGAPEPAFAILFLAIAFATSPLIGYQLDLLLEATVREETTTGRVRAAFITAASIGLVLAPLAIGIVLGEGNAYHNVFFAAAASLAPFIVLFLIEKLPQGVTPIPSKLASALVCMWKDRDLRAVTLAYVVLQMFFNLAPLYASLYLHTELGIPWSDLGWIFAFALVPFIFLEYPAGWLADRFIGDKELLIGGFVVMGISFALLAMVTVATPLMIIFGILLMTRVGAAFAEAMIEGHFFRRVSERDASTVGVFRMMRPVGALVAPVAASLILALGNYTDLFILTGGLITFLGVIATLSMRDVR